MQAVYVSRMSFKKSQLLLLVAVFGIGHQTHHYRVWDVLEITYEALLLTRVLRSCDLPNSIAVPLCRVQPHRAESQAHI
jgi:hypothetical protein